MRPTLRVLVLFALVAAAPARAFAWHDTGHMLVSQIAYLKLTPAAKARVDALLVPQQGRRPLIHLCAGYYTPDTCEKIYDPVTIGVWMDDFRGDSLNRNYDNWHYINYNPFFDGIPVRTNVGAEPENVLSRLYWSINTLRQGTGRDQTDAEVLGFLYHLAGDVHQPLHATTRYTAALPDGDAGGNGFRIRMPADARISNLHSFWDAVGGSFGFESPKRPLDQAGKNRMRSLAEELMRETPESAVPEMSDLDPHTWVVESNTLARQFAFRGITENSAPSDAYTEQARKLARKRIALAGYRLAGVLNALFIPRPPERPRTGS